MPVAQAKAKRKERGIERKKQESFFFFFQSNSCDLFLYFSSGGCRICCRGERGCRRRGGLFGLRFEVVVSEFD